MRYKHKVVNGFHVCWNSQKWYYITNTICCRQRWSKASDELCNLLEEDYKLKADKFVTWLWRWHWRLRALICSLGCGRISPSSQTSGCQQNCHARPYRRSAVCCLWDRDQHSSGRYGICRRRTALGGQVKIGCCSPCCWRSERCCFAQTDCQQLQRSASWQGGQIFDRSGLTTDICNVLNTIMSHNCCLHRLELNLQWTLGPSVP